MCGIVAIFGINHLETVKKGLSKIRHRGLDETNIWSSEQVSIGFNRLAINDKSSKGSQPFEFKNLIGVFNGEIYNSDKLKQKFNITTNSTSDMEVMLPLFEIIGTNIISYLDGFYAGIIYNKVTQQIFLLRDFIGKKPLFFCTIKNAFGVISELKAINDIHNFIIVPKGISELSNGTINVLKKHQQLQLPKDRLKEQLILAVKKRIPKQEKKFGVFLSGGLDSSIIASIVSQHTTDALYYTLGNKDDMFFVSTLSKYLGIEKQLKYINLPPLEELPTLIEKIVYHTESYNPSIISNGLATYLLAMQAYNDNLKVVLSGEGADELFCGYKIDDKERLNKRTTFISNMHFTELRRLDLASMANTIEVRCPFLDQKVYYISNSCGYDDLINNKQGKQLLRKFFKAELPYSIISRNKMSFDVGSGIRKIVVEYLTSKGKTEKAQLKKIWGQYFQQSLSNHPYFHCYPIFDKAIENRSISHQNTELKKIERLLLHEFKSIPFHNLFMLNNKKKIDLNLGGTCSDKVLHFKKVLQENGISSKLHSSFINNVECHRMLTVELHNKQYFIDVGSGWPSIQLFPAFQPVEYTVYGMTFKTEVTEKELFIYHKTKKEFRLMIKVPLESKSERDILLDIERRFEDTSIYPFKNSLRFSIVIEEDFYFIKGSLLRIFNKNKIISKQLSLKEARHLIQSKLNFNLTNLKLNF